ncbi:MAG: sigma-70 family RNA polymerase sigma factor [Phycisphaerales bacterium]|nr:sigma-70 family RNA polymerase sigma factor [Phycisphaerales bacterium]
MTDASQTTGPDFEDLSHRVYRLCLALLHDGEAAQDAMQEAMLRAWSRREARRADVSWWTWCGGFAVRVCREFMRRRRKAPLALDGSVHDVMLRNTEGGANESDVAAVRDAVERLPRRQREVTVLRFYLGLSTEETATLLGCPSGTVKSNLHKALASLEAAMSRELTGHRE